MVVPSFLINQSEIAKGVKKVEKKFKPRYTNGEGWMGDPGIFIRVLLSDAAAKKMADAFAGGEVARALARQIEDSMDEYVDPLGKGVFSTLYLQKRLGTGIPQRPGLGLSVALSKDLLSKPIC